MKFLTFSQTKILGSSLALPANGLGGSRATSSLVAHFALQNTASNSAEKKESSPRGRGGKGGVGGNSATPERIQKADSSAVLLVQSRTPHKSFLFLLEEKINRLIYGPGQNRTAITSMRMRCFTVKLQALHISD